jgi:HEPN domain-containing protein
MNAEPEALAWIGRAEEDYVLARSSLRRKKPLLYGACFHAQQCVEKYLKAVLIVNKVMFPKTHDLVALNDLAKKSGWSGAVEDDQLDIVSAYAVQVRYPGVEPTLVQAQQAIDIAKLVRRDVRKLFGL